MESLVLQWAVAVRSQDGEAVSTLLDDKFTYFGQPAAAYIESVKETIVGDVSLEFADMAEHGDEVTISPVVVYENRLVKNPLPLSITAARREDAWRLVSIGIATLPDELDQPLLPGNQVLFDVPVSVRDDDTGRGIETRISVTDGDGHYWPPQGHMKNVATGWREQLGGDVVIGHQTFAYVGADFVLGLSRPGSTRSILSGDSNTSPSL